MTSLLSPTTLQGLDDTFAAVRKRYDDLDLRVLPASATAVFPQRRSSGSDATPSGPPPLPLDPAHPSTKEAVLALQDASMRLVHASSVRPSIEGVSGLSATAMIQVCCLLHFNRACVPAPSTLLRPYPRVQFTDMIAATDLAVRNAEAALARAVMIRDTAQNQRWAASLTEQLAASATAAANPPSPASAGPGGARRAGGKKGSGKQPAPVDPSAAMDDPVWDTGLSPRGDGILAGIIGPSGHRRISGGTAGLAPIDDALSDVASVAGGSLLSYTVPLSPRSNPLSSRGAGGSSLVGSTLPSPNAASSGRVVVGPLGSHQLTPTASSVAGSASGGFGAPLNAAVAASSAAAASMPPATPSPSSATGASVPAGVAFPSTAGGAAAAKTTAYISPSSGAPPRLPTPRRQVSSGNSPSAPLPHGAKSPMAVAAVQQKPPTPRPEQAALRARLRALTTLHFEASDRLQTTQARLEALGIPLQPPMPQPSPFPPGALSTVTSTTQSVDVAAKLGRAASRLLAACSKVVDAGTSATDADEALQVRGGGVAAGVRQSGSPSPNPPLLCSAQLRGLWDSTPAWHRCGGGRARRCRALLPPLSSPPSLTNARLPPH